MNLFLEPKHCFATEANSFPEQVEPCEVLLLLNSDDELTEIEQVDASDFKDYAIIESSSPLVPVELTDLAIKENRKQQKNSHLKGIRKNKKLRTEHPKQRSVRIKAIKDLDSSLESVRLQALKDLLDCFDQSKTQKKKISMKILDLSYTDEATKSAKREVLKKIFNLVEKNVYWRGEFAEFFGNEKVGRREKRNDKKQSSDSGSL